MPALLSRRGQNVMEYILLATAVMVVLITMVLIKGGPFVKATESMLLSPAKMLKTEQMKSCSCEGINASNVTCGVKKMSPTVGCEEMLCVVGTECVVGSTCKNDTCVPTPVTSNCHGGSCVVETK